ncbi:hypothetical protein [Cryptosporangium minutisporangium]|uniref:Uncharacterized protein n=1 Tax=Cryptosporangium minutisporangium TaxID=113569 RepID=A0ABP6SYR6_9ACTN
MAHVGLGKALVNTDTELADRHRREGRRLFAMMQAVDPYHVAGMGPTIIDEASTMAGGIASTNPEGGIHPT